MPNEMLDILVDKKKVEEIAVLSTPEEVEKKLKQEGVDVTSEDVKVLGNVFDAASKKLDEDALNKIDGGSINWKSPKAIKAYKIIGGVVGAVGVGVVAYEVDKHKFGGAGMDAIKTVPGKVRGWFNRSGAVAEKSEIPEFHEESFDEDDEI